MNDNIQFVLNADKDPSGAWASKALSAKFNKRPKQWSYVCETFIKARQNETVAGKYSNRHLFKHPEG
jgi:hypothetical protein